MAQAGDAIIFNAANSVVGQALLQLGSALRLRCLAVVREHGADELAATRARLLSLGATLVLADTGSLQVRARLLEVECEGCPKPCDARPAFGTFQARMWACTTSTLESVR